MVLAERPSQAAHQSTKNWDARPVVRLNYQNDAIDDENFALISCNLNFKKVEIWKNMYCQDETITYDMTPMLMNESIIASFESTTQATD